jgi:uncharacterized protein
VTTPQWPTVEPEGQPSTSLTGSTPGSTAGLPTGYGAGSPPGGPPPRYPPAPPYQSYQPYQPYQPWPEHPAGKPPPHRWGFGAFLLAEAVFLFTSLLVPLVAMIPYALRDSNAVDDGRLPGPVLVAVLVIPPLVAAAVALLATKLRGNGPVVDLRLRFGWRDVGIGAACGFAGLLLTIPVGLLWMYWVGEENATSAVGEVFDNMQMPIVLAALVFLDVWLVAPICEEILYRGLLWGAMERREWNRWIILGVTTVVFAVAHFEPARAPLLLVIGLPIGVARMISGRLVAPVIAHQINNFLPALGLMLLLLGHPIPG